MSENAELTQQEAREIVIENLKKELAVNKKKRAVAIIIGVLALAIFVFGISFMMTGFDMRAWQKASNIITILDAVAGFFVVSRINRYRAVCKALKERLEKAEQDVDLSQDMDYVYLAQQDSLVEFEDRRGDNRF